MLDARNITNLTPSCSILMLPQAKSIEIFGNKVTFESHFSSYACAVDSKWIINQIRLSDFKNSFFGGFVSKRMLFGHQMESIINFIRNTSLH
ncbi:CLUMA_CG021156, isoform A [Clunio marinus]|uniref:CLUMA_CG021156, isoform A n=1 Tax=Clunio marinus TaxID=568069 RepID=A0A1J1J696_9DIPT|nr:CLUMA_CG021156, isoform A [Clunio marinus]